MTSIAAYMSLLSDISAAVRLAKTYGEENQATPETALFLTYRLVDLLNEDFDADPDVGVRWSNVHGVRDTFDITEAP